MAPHPHPVTTRKVNDTLQVPLGTLRCSELNEVLIQTDESRRNMQPDATLERRHLVRHRTFLQGRVLYNGGRSSIDCIIRELTDDGARLVFSGTAPLPHAFDLNIPNRDMTVRVEIIWNNGNEVGVKFSSGAQPVQAVPTYAPAAPAVPQVSLAERVEKLERELNALRRRIADLEAKNG